MHIYSVTEDVAFLVKCLVYKHKGHNSIPRTHKQSQAHTYNPITGGQRQTNSYSLPMNYTA